MKIKNQVLLITLLVSGLVLFSHQRSAAQNDDQPAPRKDAAAPAKTDDGAQNADADIKESVTNAPSADEATTDQKNSKRRTGRHRDAVVSFGTKAELKAGETAEAVVAILGSAVARGDVREAVVAIAGDVTVAGEVGDAAVAVLGDVKIEPGSIVKGDVVSVGGNVTIAEGAKVQGQVVAVGGKVDIAEGATTEGGVQEVPIPGLHLLKDWLVQCVFKLRPLAPQIGWVWVVAGAFFLLYLLVAVALPRPVEVCLGELTRRPATTFLMGLLTKLLLPVVLLILVATGIGVFVVPFLLAALMFGAIIGKVAFLEYLGQSVGRAFGTTAFFKPLAAFLIGAIILTLLYMVPVLGLITLGVSAVWGLGAVVMAVFTGVRREAPTRPNSRPPANGSGAAMNVAAAAPLGAGENAGPAGSTMTAAEESASVPSPGAAPPGAPAAVSEALALPRASFWERMAAGFLDIILVSILSALVDHMPLGFLVALAYFAGMWTWRGTTVGGIVLNLRVVRYDGKPMNFAVALIRALAAGFSIIVFFLGFLWIAWSRDKQGWHDKIAGTVVVRQPRGMPLLCI
jgi:uncharacterized RDD family membrane protein YckC